MGQQDNQTQPTYIVAVEDLFKVEANSEEEAEQIVRDRIGEEPFEVYNTKVIEEAD